MKDCITSCTVILAFLIEYMSLITWFINDFLGVYEKLHYKFDCDLNILHFNHLSVQLL